MFEKAKMYYEAGVWTREMLQNLVRKGKLTQREYDMIISS